MFALTLMSATVVVLIAMVVSAQWAIRCGGRSDFAALVGGILVGMSGAVLLITMAIVIMCSFDWIAAEHKAKIINSEYGTNYSREEVFFASSVIDTVRELDRKRIEVNGELIHGK